MRSRIQQLFVAGAAVLGTLAQGSTAAANHVPFVMTSDQMKVTAYHGGIGSRFDDAYSHCLVGSSFGLCVVHDHNGQTKSCSTTSWRLLAEMRSIDPNTYSWVRFDSNGNCTSISTYHDSYYTE